MPEPLWLDLQGASNARDVGELPAGGPRRTRSGVLVRSDAVHELTDADVAMLTEGFRLRHVVDLRTEGERRDQGRGLLGQADVSYSELEILTDTMIAERRQERAVALEDASTDPALLTAEGYWQFLTEASGAFVSGLERLAAPAGTPALVHCTAGKDRTGVLVALLLDAAGVQRDAIVADYAATDERMAQIRQRLAAMPVYADLAMDAPAMFMTAHAAVMEQFLDRLHLEAGGAANWFITEGGAPELLDAWRTKILH